MPSPKKLFRLKLRQLQIINMAVYFIAAIIFYVQLDGVTGNLTQYKILEDAKSIANTLKAFRTVDDSESPSSVKMSVFIAAISTENTKIQWAAAGEKSSPQSAFEKQAWDYFTKSTKAEISFHEVDEVKGLLKVAIVDRLENSEALGIFVITQPLEDAMISAELGEMKLVLLILTIVSIGIIGGAFLKIIGITQTIDVLSKIVDGLKGGKIDHENIKPPSNELEDIVIGINQMSDNMRSLTGYAKDIGDGNLTSTLDGIDDEHILGAALIDMKTKLAAVISETNEVISKAGDQGMLDASMHTEGKQGAWLNLSQAINHLIASIANPVLEVNKIVTAMAEGDLRPRFNENAKGDVLELANNLNKALNNLNQLLYQIAESSHTVEESSNEMLNKSEEMSSNTREIAAAVAQMSEGAHNQVTRVDESSNLVEGILKSSTDMSRRSETINDAAKNGVNSSEKGLKMVNNVVGSMGEISDYSAKTNESILVLTERSNEISRVLGVITDIASQTNLLALNAAIEAAQAGDAGRGFAVVAEEIRKLAEDSRKSANEIETLVRGVQKDTSEAERIISEMGKSVKSGEGASQEVSKVFKEMADSSTQTLTLSEDILNASQTQIADITNVVTITENVVVIAEQTAAGTEEVASSTTELSSGMDGYTKKSQDLSNIARLLKEGVGKFKLSEETKVK